MRPAAAAEQARVIPAPTQDETATTEEPRTVVLAGGCFWGVQGVFQHTKGVINAVSGYAGGDMVTADYDKVSTGVTGHAESVQVTYDPKQISYDESCRSSSLSRSPTAEPAGPRAASVPLGDFSGEPSRLDLPGHIAQLNQARAFDTPSSRNSSRIARSIRRYPRTSWCGSTILHRVPRHQLVG
jgi:peptide-methionine (S)-S-oxide reductase